MHRSAGAYSPPSCEQGHMLCRLRLGRPRIGWVGACGGPVQPNTRVVIQPHGFPTPREPNPARADSGLLQPASDCHQGDWAERNLPEMTDAELNGFAVVLDLENPDLFKWLTGQLPPPPEMVRARTARGTRGWLSK